MKNSAERGRQRMRERKRRKREAEENREERTTDDKIDGQTHKQLAVNRKKVKEGGKEVTR